MIKKPWKDWIPGVLCDKQIKTLCKEGFIKDAGNSPSTDASSIDLHLSDEGYEMTGGSVKPFGKNYFNELESQNQIKKLAADKDGTYTLRPNRTYLFKIRERLQNFDDKSSIHGQATARSSIGRLDVLARLIVDGMDCYESFTPEGIYGATGDMYLEITPITFPVRVKKGVKLSQLRFFYCAPESAGIRGKELCQNLLLRQDGHQVENEVISVDLSEAATWAGECCAFCAEGKRNESPISLWEQPKSKRPDPRKYWRGDKAQVYDEVRRLRIEKDAFYILRSKERLSLPPGIAVYCRAIDETIGEMRIHYAGFAHPGFGWGKKSEPKGTPLMFEVRGHNVHVSLRDGERMARLVFYRMSDIPQKLNESYQHQTLELSKFFGKDAVKGRKVRKKLK